MLIILADAELELIPESIKRDGKVATLLKRLGKEDSILDNALLRSVIEKYYPGDVNRMGFPHIAYSFVRLNEDTVLRETMKIDYAIHTKHDRIIESSTLGNIGPGYAEFVERVEEILSKRGKRVTLLEYLEQRGITGNTAVLHPTGNKGLVFNGQLNYVIGGFPEGDFRTDLGSLRRFSIHDGELTVPAVLELLHFKLYQQ